MNNIRNLINLVESIQSTSKFILEETIPKAEDFIPEPVVRTYTAGTLGLGSRGPEVTALQDKLITAGLLDPTTGPGGKPANDGIFGPNTQHAVQNLQDRLGVSKDGIYGPNTQRALAAKPEAIAPKKTTIVAPPVAPIVATTTQVSSEAEQQAQYQKFYDEQKAKEAKQAAETLFKSRVQSRYAVKSGMTIIGKEDGVLYWADATTRGETNDQQTGRAMSMDMYNQGTNFVDQPLKDAITTLGKKVVPYVKPMVANTMARLQAAPDGSASIEGFNVATKLESVGFQADEVNRIVSLVHHR